MVRFVIILVLVALVIGLLWPYLGNFGLGRLPGDVVIARKNRTYYFPVATCVILSLLISTALWWFGH
jgi:hypothetical protein